MDKKTPYSVLFLCTGNSCRSQMAEAIVNHEMGETWQAASAGTHPSGEVHPSALQVLEEIGIEHSGRPEHVNAFRDRSFDLVITVCDQAAEACPLWLGDGQVIHRGFQDPAAATGSKAEILEVFRRVRDEIRTEIPEIINYYSSQERAEKESEEEHEQRH